MFGIFKKEKPQKKDAIKDQLNAIKAEIREVEYALELLADEEVYDLDDMLIDEKYKISVFFSFSIHPYEDWRQSSKSRL